VATALILVACGGESGPNAVQVGSITVSPNPLALAQQTAAEFQVAVFDADGALLAGMPVTFTSANVELVTVNSAGLVRSVGPAGTSSVTVTAGTKSVSVPVSVGASGNTIAVLPEPAALAQLGTLQLDPALLDLVGTEIMGSVFTYESTNPLIVTVTGSGQVRSIGPAGEATINVTSGAVTAQKSVTVTATPTSITLNPNPIAIGRTGQLQLGAQVLDAIGSPIVGSAVAFSAQPSNLLAISQTGLLSAQGVAGSGSVTATSGALTVTAPVTISNAGTLTGAIVRTVGVTGAPYGVAMGAGGVYYGVGLNGALDVGTFGVDGLTRHNVSAAVMTGVAVHPTNGRVYATGAGADGLMEINPTTGTVMRRWEVQDQMYDVAISPDGTRLYVAGGPMTVYVISVATMQMLTSYPTEASVIHLVAHPSMPLIYASGVGVVREINVTNGAFRTFSHPAAQATALAIAGDRLFIGGEAGHLASVDLTSAVTTTVEVPCPIYDLVAAPDAGRLLATCTGTGTALLLDAQTFGVVATIATGGAPRRAAIRADGTGAVIANEAGWYTHVQ
jgi:hypothetical protein